MGTLSASGFLWVKAFHIIFMVTWFAALFYLPRLFVYHSLSTDQASIDRFKIMERKLYFGIMMPGMVLTVAFGLWLLLPRWSAFASFGWIYLKLVLVALLIVYHFWCGTLVKRFKHDQNAHTHVWYRWFNEVPVLFLIVVVILAVVRPF